MEFLKNIDYRKLTHIFYRVFKAKPSGLEPTPKDERDYNTGIFKWGSYTPKEQKKIISTITVKDQGNYNTCQWNATIGQKEPDEKVPLSVRRLVSYGKRKGMVSGNGFSNLRSGQDCLLAYGAEVATVSSENAVGWEDYSNSTLNEVEAAKHKIQSYWQVNSRDDLMKVLDDNRIVVTGLEWFTGFNQGGGFSSPWIISRKIGYSIGGHAFIIKGYIQNYYGKFVLVAQNSYGKEWGDNGDFYIELNYFLANNWGLYVNLDIQSDTAGFLNKYDGMNVKGSKSSIWHIQKGFKKAYPDWVTYLAFNGLVRGYKQLTKDEEKILEQVGDGERMDITKSIYWDFIKYLKEPENLNKLLEILNKQ